MILIAEFAVIAGGVLVLLSALEIDHARMRHWREDLRESRNPFLPRFVSRRGRRMLRVGLPLLALSLLLRLAAWLT